MALRQAVSGIHGHASAIVPGGQLQRVMLEDETVGVRLAAESGSMVDVNIMYMEPSSYPSSGVLVVCSDDKYEERVGRLSERFQEKAPLAAVISKVLDAFNIAYDEHALHSSASGNPDFSQDANDAPDDPMSEDGSFAGTGSDMDGSEQQDSSEDDDDEDQEDKDLILHIGMRTSAWERREAELGTSSAAQDKSEMSLEQKLASHRQIFNPREAYMRLTTELVDIIKRQDPFLIADSVGNDVYQWDVTIANFSPGSALAKDLQDLSRRCPSSSVQLRLTFVRGLHPFYPPQVEVVRPHFVAPVAAAVAAHPLFQLHNWEPFRPITEVVALLKQLLEEHGRVDLDHPRNLTAADSPSGAYHPVQAALNQLAGLVAHTHPSVLPADYALCKDTYEGCRQYQSDTASLQAVQSAKKARTGSEAASSAAAGAGAAAASGLYAASAAGGAAGSKAWAQGTGYGTSGTSYSQVWDPKATAAAHEAQDKQFQTALEHLVQGLAHALGGSSSSSNTAAAGSGASSQPSAPPAAAAATSTLETACSPEEQEMVLASTQRSVLLPFIAHELSGKTIKELSDRHAYYSALLRVCQELCRPASEQLLAGHPLPLPVTSSSASASTGRSSSSGLHLGHEHLTALTALRGLRNGAQLFLKSLQSTSALSAPAAGPSSSSRPLKSQEKADELATADAMRGKELAERLLGVLASTEHLTPAKLQQAAAPSSSAAVPGASASAAATPGSPERVTRRSLRSRSATNSSSAAAAAAAATPAAPATGAADATPAAAGAAGAAGGGPGQQRQQSKAEAAVAATPEQEVEYAETLRPLLVRLVETPFASHKYAATAAADTSRLKPRAARVPKELGSLENSLSISTSSSVFVRVSEANVYLWRALIIGPELTPYSGGCFIFDIYFPSQYPNVPPQVNMIAQCTGAGTVRFNPNLYNCGKVCLSLLGTWSGRDGEGWTPDASSALQVLISIQSLILVPQPYFNEPGYESNMRTPAGAALSFQYNTAIREACIKWAMLDQLRRPQPEFKDVIEAHFRLRGAALLRQVDVWAEEATTTQGAPAGHAQRLRDLRGELERELAML